MAQEKLETVKAPSAKSVLVIKNQENENSSIESQERVENAIMNNNISVISS